MNARIKRLWCVIRGHKWEVGFAETTCHRCDLLKIDRLWQLYGDAKCREVTQAVIAALKADYKP